MSDDAAVFASAMFNLGLVAVCADVEEGTPPWHPVATLTVYEDEEHTVGNTFILGDAGDLGNLIHSLSKLRDMAIDMAPKMQEAKTDTEVIITMMEYLETVGLGSGSIDS